MRFAGSITKRLTSVAYLLTPPIIRNAASRLRTRAVEPTKSWFECPLGSWEEAQAHVDGWEAPDVTKRALEAARKVRDGKAAFERDRIVYDKIIYSPTILACLFLAADRYETLDVVDFGGGLGSNYYQHRHLLRALHKPVRWCVIERPSFVRLGSEEFQTEELCFSDDIRAAVHARATVLFTASLQYIAEPFATLASAITADIVALDRVPLSPNDNHAVYVQRHPPELSTSTRAVWCFSRDGMMRWFDERGFRLVEHFTDDPNRHFDLCGLLFIRDQTAVRM